MPPGWHSERNKNPNQAQSACSGSVFCVNAVKVFFEHSQAPFAAVAAGACLSRRRAQAVSSAHTEALPLSDRTWLTQSLKS